jgi:threonine dehydratase
MLYALQSLQCVVEGGGAVALAALLAEKWGSGLTDPETTVGVVLSGGNVSIPRLEALTRD